MQRPITIAWIATAIMLALPWAATAQDGAREALSADNVFQSSLVAAEDRDRSTFLQDIGKGERTPSIDEIKRLWTTATQQYIAHTAVLAGREELRQRSAAGVERAAKNE